jgi:hypothetical protein
MVCAVSLSMIVGSSAFTSTSADRSVSVDVVEDENAYLGIQSGATLQCGNPEQNTILQNQFAMTLDTVTIEVRNPATSEEDIKVSPKGDGHKEKLEPGESTQIEFDESYSSGNGPRLQINPVQGATPENIYIAVVNATGAEMTVSAEEREFSVDCASEDVEEKEEKEKKEEKEEKEDGNNGDDDDGDEEDD